MITNTNNGNELAQIGWLKYVNWSSSSVYFFYEYGQSGGLNPPEQLFVDTNAANYGTSNEFTVYTQGNGQTDFIINGVGQFNTYLNSTPNRAEWLGEVHSTGDQMAGDYNHPVYFNYVQHLYNGTWYNDNASVNQINTDTSQNGGYGAGNWPNANWCAIWDTRYGSEA
ncbi:hypothetical protein TPY_2056 [Sulfobacillus acidophilus TPY]|nr:hypothetical protein TPY_2056 [Sulfobacillus acidophilus TPY]